MCYAARRVLCREFEGVAVAQGAGVQASSFDQFTGTEKYIVSPDLHDAVNVSIVLQRLLLVKGEPGTGKTLLAHNIARALGKPLLVWNIQPTTKAKALSSLPPPPVPRPSPCSHPSGSAYPMRRRLSSS